MATTVTPDTIRTRAPSFNDLSDAAIQLAIDEAERWMNETEWGPSHYNDGVFYLSCHILEEDAALADTDGEGGEALPAGPLVAEKILSWSVRYGEGPSAFDDAMATTAWGRRYIARRDCIFVGRVI
jgi:hypothetical protein